jgi:DMSO/TMAO reductase YedYZ heme-binding membrane subunit
MAVIPLAASPSPLWYLARGSGAVSLVLLSVAVVLGITGVVRLQPRSRRVPRFLVDGLHRNVSLVVVVFLVTHILTSVLDPFAHIRYVDAIVPFASSYRPIWLGLGATAFDLLLALTITSLVRRRLGLRTWRAIHWAAYACWPLAVVHGLTTGSDARVAWFSGLTAVCVAAVVAALGFRLRAESTRRPERALAGGLLVAASFAGLFLFALQGPLRRGWAARAGTPPKLLASVRPVRAARAPAPARRAPAGLALPLAGSVDGTLTRSGTANGGGRIDITANVRSRPRPAVIAIALTGQPLEDGGLRVEASTASLGVRSAPRLYTSGQVSVDGSNLVAVLRPHAGRSIRMALSLSVPNGSGRVTGSARVERL